MQCMHPTTSLYGAPLVAAAVTDSYLTDVIQEKNIRIACGLEFERGEFSRNYAYVCESFQQTDFFFHNRLFFYKEIREDYKDVLQQCGPTKGPRIFQWSAEAFKKIFEIC